MAILLCISLWTLHQSACAIQMSSETSEPVFNWNGGSNLEQSPQEYAKPLYIEGVYLTTTKLSAVKHASVGDIRPESRPGQGEMCS